MAGNSCRLPHSDAGLFVHRVRCILRETSSARHETERGASNDHKDQRQSWQRTDDTVHTDWETELAPVLGGTDGHAGAVAERGRCILGTGEAKE